LPWRAPWKAHWRGVPDFVVDARVARRRFERAAGSYAGASRLETEIGARMLERLDYVKLAPRRVLDAGSGPLRDARRLAKRYRGAQVLALDFSPGMLRAGHGWLDVFGKKSSVCGDIAHLPFAAGAIDLVWSNMVLHWAADPLAALREFHRVLAVEGLLMFSTLGPDTLAELRAAAGVARVHAFADMHDLGDMLVAAGFAEPVMDMERLTVEYADGGALLADLRASGQTCALAGPAGEPQRGLRGPRGLAGRGFLAALKARLAAQHRGGKLPVSYEVVYGHAWKPAPRRAADGRAIVQFDRRPP
jgi:malonyl-CoA O-methyltransferase